MEGVSLHYVSARVCRVKNRKEGGEQKVVKPMTRLHANNNNKNNKKNDKNNNEKNW